MSQLIRFRFRWEFLFLVPSASWFIMQDEFVMENYWLNKNPCAVGKSAEKKLSLSIFQILYSSHNKNATFHSFWLNMPSHISISFDSLRTTRTFYILFNLTLQCVFFKPSSRTSYCDNINIYTKISLNIHITDGNTEIMDLLWSISPSTISVRRFWSRWREI